MDEMNKPVVVETEPELHVEPKKDKVISWKQILLIALLIVLLLFMIFNFNQVEVNLLFGKIQAPLVIVIFLSYILGSLVTWLMNALKKDKN